MSSVARHTLVPRGQVCAGSICVGHQYIRQSFFQVMLYHWGPRYFLINVSIVGCVSSR